jgi:hypothetical protein
MRSRVVQVVFEEAANAEPCSAELSISGNVVCSGYAGKVDKMLQRFCIDEHEMSLQAWPQKERELYQLNMYSILEEAKCLAQMRIHCPERYGM